LKVFARWLVRISDGIRNATSKVCFIIFTREKIKFEIFERTRLVYFVEKQIVLASSVLFQFIMLNLMKICDSNSTVKVSVSDKTKQLFRHGVSRGETEKCVVFFCVSRLPPQKAVKIYLPNKGVGFRTGKRLYSGQFRVISRLPYCDLPYRTLRVCGTLKEKSQMQSSSIIQFIHLHKH
jgi:hypothetical protein